MKFKLGPQFFHKILIGLCSVLVTVFSVYLYVHAGNIDSPAIPSNDTGRMYTLKNIYDYLNSVDSAVPSKPSGGFAEPSSAPAGTMYTTDSIFAKLVRLPATGQTTSYTNISQTCADGGTGYCDDGYYQREAALRYTDNGDGTITDDNTKLMWKKCSEGLSGDMCDTGSATSMVWDSTGGSPDALSTCYNLDYAGYTDWRLPNLKELVSIVNYGNVGPAIDITAFPNTVSDSYWSSTTYADFTDSAWIVYFYGGNPTYDFKTFAYYVRCVRGQ